MTAASTRVRYCLPEAMILFFGIILEIDDPGRAGAALIEMYRRFGETSLSQMIYKGF